MGLNGKFAIACLWAQNTLPRLRIASYFRSASPVPSCTRITVDRALTAITNTCILETNIDAFNKTYLTKHMAALRWVKMSVLAKTPHCHWSPGHYSKAQAPKQAYDTQIRNGDCNKAPQLHQSRLYGAGWVYRAKHSERPKPEATLLVHNSPKAKHADSRHNTVRGVRSDSQAPAIQRASPCLCSAST